MAVPYVFKMCLIQLLLEFVKLRGIENPKNSKAWLFCSGGRIYFELQSSANDCDEFIFWPEAVPVTCSLLQTLLLQVPVEMVLC